MSGDATGGKRRPVEETVRLDRDAGRVRPLAEYLKEFPADEDAVVQAYYASRSAGEPESVGMIGRYRLLRELGRGGQGVVYMAEDTRLGRSVALKVLSRGFGTTDATMARFRREAEITSRLDHPGICPVYDVGVASGVSYIAMKYIEGQTLHARLQPEPAGDFHVVEASTERRRVSPPPVGSEPESGSAGPETWAGICEALRLFEEAALALHAAHEAHVVHRDVKPGNIMIDGSGHPVILDFGLARDASGEMSTLTQSGDLMGTPAYMSPEQVAGSRIALDRRTDVYSLGVTLYETLTGGRPFDGASREALYQAILTKEPPDPRRRNRAISAELKVVLETALEKDRDRRYQTAQNLAEDLRRIREHRPILARPAGPVLRLRRWVRRNPVLTSFVVSLALGLGASLILWSRADRNAREARAQTLRADAKSREVEARAAEARDSARLAESRARSEAAALSEYRRMSDVKRLETLKREMSNLLPPVPDRVEPMEAWLRRARGLLSSRPLHEARLDELRRLARPAKEAGQRSELELYPGWEKRASLLSERERFRRRVRDLGLENRAGVTESRALVEAQLARVEMEIEELDMESESRTRAFPDPEVQWMHDVLSGLVSDLRAFGASERGDVRRVETWLAFAREVRKRSLEGDAAELWKRAIASIGDPAQCPQYGGLTLKPQLGLVPIGRDPASGLWEFAHLQSGVAAERGRGGRLVLREEMGIVLVLLPGGGFQMGAERPSAERPPGSPNVDPLADPNERPIHEVHLSPFFLSKYEMTQSQWERWVGRNPSQYGPGSRHGANVTTRLHPVESVSWEDATRVSRELGLELPTEAQWEYGCRGGTGTVWWTGDESRTLAGTANLADAYCHARNGPPGWVYEMWLDDGYVAHAPVGTYRGNGYGLHDVVGNVFEWCRDRYGPYKDPVSTETGERRARASDSIRVNRGGAFSGPAGSARSALRNGGVPGHAVSALGFRPARAIEE